MELNPILTETELRVACRQLVETGQLERVVRYFIKNAWDKALVVTNEKELVKGQKVLANYEDLLTKIKNAGNTTHPSTKLHF